MKMGIIGLGRMGNAIAQRVKQAGHDIWGFDPDAKAQDHARDNGINVAKSLEQLAQEARIIMLMVPAGKVVDSVIASLTPHLQAGDILIDGGNSNYENSIRREQELITQEIAFLDCGTSGGVHGLEFGFCLMVGGSATAYRTAEPILTAIAAPGALAHVGPPGSGHYVKMVHNGIEYAVLQAYAEGLHLIKEGSFADAHINLEEVTRIWNVSSIIRSWILELTYNVLRKDQDLKKISGEIGGGQTGQWTVQEAEKTGIPTPLIKQSLETRSWARVSGGNYGTKLIALLRNQFGGHPFKTTDDNA